MIAVALVGLTLLGFALRLANIDQSLIGDELSTLWILDRSDSLGDLLSSIRSNDEITPPLYFILAWLTLQVNPDPEWLRLPSLLAGTATIPLVYLLGQRTIGRSAGLIGAAVFALSPFLIYYGTEARAYSVMMALVAGSTLALLAACETRRTRWWVLYGVCSLGAIYSHYTSAFPLAAQFAWVLWAHREALRPLLLTNLGVLAGFAPWIPGFIADNTSPTTEILSRLIPFTFAGIRAQLESWAIGYPYLELDAVPGRLGVVLILAGFLVALVAGGVRAARAVRRADSGLAALLREHRGAVLIALLALSAPVCEFVFSAIGTDIIGARNLNSSWPGLAAAIGGVLATAGPIVAVASTVAVLGGFAIGAVKAVDGSAARIDVKGPAEVIEERSDPGDPVIDAYAFTPVPLTPLDAFLPQTQPEYRLNLPISDEPFAFGDPIPPPERLINQALREARGGKLYLVAPLGGAPLSETVRQAEELRSANETLGTEVLRRAQPRFEITYEETFDGLAPIGLFELTDRGSKG